MSDREHIMRENAAIYAASFELEYEIRQEERAAEREYWNKVRLPNIKRRAERDRLLNQITNQTNGVRHV